MKMRESQAKSRSEPSQSQKQPYQHSKSSQLVTGFVILIVRPELQLYPIFRRKFPEDEDSNQHGERLIAGSNSASQLLISTCGDSSASANYWTVDSGSAESARRRAQQVFGSSPRELQAYPQVPFFRTDSGNHARS